MNKKIFFITFISLLVLFSVIFLLSNNKKEVQKDEGIIINDTYTNMQIKSPVFKNNGKIPSKYTCDGEDTNPPLEFLDIPKEAESLALVSDDPDAPGKTWVHWIVWNIDPQTIKIEENSTPKGSMEGLTSFGKTNYGGPCPPSGEHRYFFKIYALDIKIDLTPKSTKEDLEEAMKGHILERAEIVGLYEKN